MAMRYLSVFLSGFLFSGGLIVSGMINPAKVIGFLNLFGQWDPSLAFVMAGAVAVTFFGYRKVLTKDRPIFANSFSIPTRTDIDRSLIAGPILFGIGWGMVGLCPGPALAALTASPETTWVFFISMIVGMLSLKIFRARSSNDSEPLALSG